MRPYLCRCFRHEPVEEAVDTPLVFQAIFHGEEEIPAIAVQWNDCEHRGQFQFFLTTPPNRIEGVIGCDPGDLEVIFLGQAKNFPEFWESFLEDIHNFSEGDGERWIMMAAAPIPSPLGKSQHKMPVIILSEVILNEDEETGKIIYPDQFQDFQMLIRLIKVINPTMEIETL